MCDACDLHSASAVHEYITVKSSYVVKATFRPRSLNIQLLMNWQRPSEDPVQTLYILITVSCRLFESERMEEGPGAVKSGCPSGDAHSAQWMY